MKGYVKITRNITSRMDASMEMFFKDVSKIPLITQEKEIELAKKIREGDKKALDLLVMSNLRFAISIAKQYQGKGIPLVDLVQESIIGLIEGARRFDERKGFRFISYAVWWIRQSITKFIMETSRTIKIPSNQFTAVRKLSKEWERFESREERMPTVEELSDKTNLSTSKINDAFSCYTKQLSLDTPISDDDNSTLADVIEDKSVESPDKDIDKDEISLEMDKLICKLPPRESDVIRMVFGIGMKPMTYTEIAEYFGVSSERIRQLQRIAIDFIKDNYKEEFSKLL